MGLKILFSTITKKDPLGFCVHFFFGALLGGFVGFWFWGRWVSAHVTSTDKEQIIAALIIIGIFTLISGLIAGYFRDRIWVK